MGEPTETKQSSTELAVCADRMCDEPAWAESPDGFCIYHAPQNGRDKETARAVWAEACRRIEKTKNCWFGGWHFPQDPDWGSFQGTTFHGEVVFEGATFQGETGFEGTRIHGNARFGDATFQGHAWFDGAIFQGEACFAGATAKAGAHVVFGLPSWPIPFRKSKPFRYREQGQTAYRLAKQAAQNRGDYRMAGAYHYAEQCASEHGRRKRAERWPWKKRFWGRRNYLRCLPELFLGRGLFGYGEKPQRALIAGVLVIFIWAGLFHGCAGIMPSRSGDLDYRPGYGKCLYFSTVTFTTLGYGDFQPKPGPLWFVAGTEALAGAALMALFIVVLARKYTR